MAKSRILTPDLESSENSAKSPIPTAPSVLEMSIDSSTETLQTVQQDLGDCRRCSLCEKRNHLVFGEGNPKARLLFIGEAPEEEDDIQGRPWIGKAGQLLDRMIEAMGLRRDDVYLSTLVKCRPSESQIPKPDQIIQCIPFLLRQIESIQPEIIVTLGKTASQTLLQTEVEITQLRGQFHRFPTLSSATRTQSIQVMPTFHPGYLLRNPAAKKEVWLDLQQVAHALGIELPKRKH